MSEGSDKLGLREVVGSVLAAMFGVQKRCNQERDFGSGRAAPFIITGLVMTILFVLVLVGAVQLLSLAA